MVIGRTQVAVSMSPSERKVHAHRRRDLQVISAAVLWCCNHSMLTGVGIYEHDLHSASTWTYALEKLRGGEVYVPDRPRRTSWLRIKTGKADFAMRAPSAASPFTLTSSLSPHRQRRQGAHQYPRISRRRRLAFWSLGHPSASPAEHSGLDSFVLRPLNTCTAGSRDFSCNPILRRLTSPESTYL